MGVRQFRPRTPSLRHTRLVDGSGLTRGAAVPKALLSRKAKVDGRGGEGRITVRRRGGASKRRYRLVDLKRPRTGVPATVRAIVHDPNRSCHLALLAHADGRRALILAPDGLAVGARVVSSDDADVKAGNAKRLRHVPLGTLVHNVELHPGSGGRFARSAGTSAQVMAKEGGEALLRMPSGELRRVKEDCMATIGRVGNPDREREKLGKAGRNRRRGRRPRVRGVAMNPVDHPHGGGEGRTSGGRHPATPSGKLTKGHKTRRNKRTDRFIVQRRKRRGRS